MPTKITKRDGRVVKFELRKIADAVHNSMGDVNEEDKDRKKSDRIAKIVSKKVDKKFAKTVPGVEDVQDLAEETLMEEGYPKVARNYILYRNSHREARLLKSMMGISSDDLKLSPNAISVLKRRYLVKDQNGKTVETPAQMFARVANAISKVDKLYKENADTSRRTFYDIMSNRIFLPNSPTLMNAGTGSNQLSACFVLPVEDSLDGIFDAVYKMVKIQQTGGGTGFSFSRLRPEGDFVKTTQGVASGPVSFIKVFNAATEAIKQGGKRRGANMGMLRYDHPDIEKFIAIKQDKDELTNFNISVSSDDKFMKAVINDSAIDLINPRSDEVVRSISAKILFNQIVSNAWKTGDPGLVFIDEVNRLNPMRKVESIEATNPCGEQPLLPYESCNLGSINVSMMVKNNEVDWAMLRNVVTAAVHFLDNVIDANTYVFKEIDYKTKANRKIGLGIMGWADMLTKLGIRYDSNDALKLAEQLMSEIQKTAKEASMNIALKRGSFQNFEQSTLAKDYKAMRNSTVTTIAPTGTISIIANVSSGIEPLFAISYVRNVMEGTELLEVNGVFSEYAKKNGFYSDELMNKISVSGSLQKIEGIPSKAKDVFVSAFDISPEWHVKMQAAFQKHVDNAVSKTVNLPNQATVEDIYKVYMLAYKLKCKGVTVYRYGSKENQVLSIHHGTNVPVIADSEYAGGCPYPYCER
jgi:ribonucleoside-diphosphate reductase alpha chain